MQVIGTVDVCDAPVLYTALRYTPDGGVHTAGDPLQEESLLDITVNDIPTMRLGCSANHLVELTVGRLFTEGLISSVEDIDYLSVCEHSMRADVYLHDRQADCSRAFVPTVPTCCTNNKTLNDWFSTGEELQPVQPVPWDLEWVFRVAREFARDKTAHAVTKGAHSAYLALPEETLCMREDIGRHNAFDKAIGWALLEGVDLRQCLLFTSGRVPTDMVTKAVRARIPLLVSKTVATDKTVELARKFNLTLICTATPESIDVLNDPAHAFSWGKEAASSARPA